MPVAPPSPERMEQVRAAQRAVLEGSVRASRPRTLNFEAVRVLCDLEELRSIRFRARAYDVLPVGYVDGLVLDQLAGRLRKSRDLASQPDQLAELRAVMDEAVVVFARLVRPRGRLRRIAWRVGLRANPFLAASEADVGALLGFFWLCRMKSSVQPTLQHSDSARPRRI